MRPGPVRVAICGGGVIGAAIAYFLSTRGVRALVIERAGIGNAASGKSGGFLALDWCRGTPVDPLARRSFELHAQLAERLGEELGLEWGYRRLDTLSVVVSQARDLGALEGDSAPGGDPNPGTALGSGWLAVETVVQGRIGTEADDGGGCSGSGSGRGSRGAGMLSSGDDGWHARDRRSARCRGRLRGHRAQRLGHAECPLTGEAVAELIVDGDATTVDIAPFRPERLEVLDPRQLGLPPTASG